MGNYDWYVKLMNFLDRQAKENRMLNRIEIAQLNLCVNRYDVADSVTQLIQDIADANDCGICNTWNELIVALHHLMEIGERIPIR